MTLTPGHWKFVQKAPNPLANPVVTGVYRVSGNRVTFMIKAPAELAGSATQGTWSYDGKALRFQGMHNDPDAHVLFTAHLWRKIG